jgi:hypothetical protein
MTNTDTFTPGPIAPALPADENGVSRSEVWAQHGCSQGDAQVGIEFEAEYENLNWQGKGHYKLTDTYFVEDVRLLNFMEEGSEEWVAETEAGPYIVVNGYYARRIDSEEDGIEWTSHEEINSELAHAFGFTDLAKAEDVARRQALMDWRHAILA